MHCHILLLILTFIVSFSCRKINNRIDDLVYACGETGAAHAGIYVYPVSPAGQSLAPDTIVAQSVDAEGGLKPLIVSEKGCVLIPHAMQSSSRVLIRAGDNKQWAFIGRVDELSARSPITLQDHADDRPIISCQNPLYINTEAFDAKLFLAGKFDPSTVFLEIKNRAGNLQRIAYNGEGWPYSLAPKQHGPQQLSLHLLNLLRQDTESQAVSCTVNLDLKAPEVTLPYARTYSLTSKDEVKVWTIAPGAAIEFKLQEDGFPQTLYYCIAKIDDTTEKPTCTADDFTPFSGILSAPDSGLWSIQYYALDRAGNRSIVQQTQFLVYHAAEIAEIKALINLGQSEFANQ